MIGYYLHHRGNGHRRRGTAVARSLRQPVTGLGTGGAPEEWPGPWVELAADDSPAVDPEAADVTAGGVLHWVPRGHRGLLRRHQQIVDWLALVRPALVVVDMSAEVSVLVRLCGVSVVVGAMPGDRSDPAHTLAYGLAEALLAPWPEGAHPEAGWPQEWLAKTWHVGGISALAAECPAGDRTTRASPGARPASAEGASGHVTPGEPGDVLVLWGSGGEPITAQQVHLAQRATPGWTWTVRGGGWPASPDLLPELAAADVVVCHAGQGSVADVALARRPAVVLAQPRPHDEQLATTTALRRLGLAATGRGWPRAERWPELLDRALTLGGDGWDRWGGDGAPRAAALLDDLADRLAA